MFENDVFYDMTQPFSDISHDTIESFQPSTTEQPQVCSFYNNYSIRHVTIFSSTKRLFQTATLFQK